MKFLLDENFPRSAAEVIAAADHEAILFSDACEFGEDDEAVFNEAQRLGAVILTAKTVFGVGISARPAFAAHGKE